jgi:hypothetical protein
MSLFAQLEFILAVVTIALAMATALQVVKRKALVRDLARAEMHLAHAKQVQSHSAEDAESAANLVYLTNEVSALANEIPAWLHPRAMSMANEAPAQPDAGDLHVRFDEWLHPLAFGARLDWLPYARGNLLMATFGSAVALAGAMLLTTHLLLFGLIGAATTVLGLQILYAAAREAGLLETADVGFKASTQAPMKDLDAKLREVAARHLTLLKQAEALADDDPQVAAIKKQAIAAIGAGDYDRADGLLQRALSLS